MLLLGFEVPLWMILTGSFAVLVYLYGTRNYGHFNKSKLPGPKVWPLIGTAAELYGDSIMATDLKLHKKYGKFIKTFEGSTPVMLVYDAEWLKEAFVKNFSLFTNRRRLLFGGALDQGLFSMEGDHWRHSRKMLSSEFSSGKLKKMMPEIQKCVQHFVQILEDSDEQPVDIRTRCYALTLDLISHTAFGLDSDAQTNEDSQFTKNALRLISFGEAEQPLKEKIRSTVAIFVVLLAPDWLVKLFAKFSITVFDAGAINYFEQLCQSVIESRKSDNPGADFVQTLVNNMKETSKGDPDTLVDTLGYNWTKKGLTKTEIIGNALLFLFAGFQTTADTMLFIFYELAQYPEIQEKLYGEITEICDSDDVTPEQVNQLKLLDYCINETMRLYPQAFRFDRSASKDVTIRDIFVPKGTAVTAVPWTIQRDPEIWEDPEEFDPYRFTPDRFTEKQVTAFMPFGIGNRLCIGSRLALMEMKLSIITALKKFEFKTCPDTPERPLEFAAVPAVTPSKKIMLSFVKREAATTD